MQTNLNIYVTTTIGLLTSCRLLAVEGIRVVVSFPSGIEWWYQLLSDNTNAISHLHLLSGLSCDSKLDPYDTYFLPKLSAAHILWYQIYLHVTKSIHHWSFCKRVHSSSTWFSRTKFSFVIKDFKSIKRCTSALAKFVGLMIAFATRLAMAAVFMICMMILLTAISPSMLSRWLKSANVAVYGIAAPEIVACGFSRSFKNTVTSTALLKWLMHLTRAFPATSLLRTTTEQASISSDTNVCIQVRTDWVQLCWTAILTFV